MNEHLLKELPINDWLFISIGDNYRLYYQPHGTDQQNGFEFYCVEQNGMYCNELTEKENWLPEYTIVECFFKGTAYFDGIRHLYMGGNETENYGYHYYPNIQNYIDFFPILQQLVDKYCREV